ncbi:MAG: hypothetical protein BVN34_05755 [Proteobacteria bacterium ST_bin12]|nr:MAG: hypothetical protein BVN34_05755 [Proteobacteria bacterium ST_bin12]
MIGLVMKSRWQLTEVGQCLENVFTDLDTVFALQGENITHDSVSDVIKVQHQNVNYYVKRYTSAGKGIKQFLGKSRIEGEWENLQWFAQWGILTATIIGFGLEKKWGLFHRGAIITQEIPNTLNLAQMAEQSNLIDSDSVRVISQSLSAYTRKIHQHGFIHNDLKWRNILINDKFQVFLIDCPLGDFWKGRMLQYRIVKDLKTLDNHAKKYLRRTQRLRFFLDYMESKRLNADSKQLLLSLLRRRSRRYDKRSNLSLILRDLY